MKDDCIVYHIINFALDGYFLAFLQVIGREHTYAIVIIKQPDYRWKV
ncbi:hypothetical protein [Commensalibacter melissae]|nr:hypothetical protein [Commensalibacter melissae]MUG81420.1 hypothetical protein [Commensalibacter melissae]